MPNWGDKLYPPTLESLLDELAVVQTTAHFAPSTGVTSSGQPIRKLGEVRRSGARIALVGGGDILRFDPRTVALDHLSIPTEARHRMLNRARARWFAARHFLDGPGPWVPNDGWLPQAPAALISAGVHTVPVDHASRRAVARYRSAWVRTSNGAERLVGAGVARERVFVAPDMIFALPELTEPDRTRSWGERIFEDRLGLSYAPVLFHAAGFHGWPLDRVRAALESLSNLPVATLALGTYAGEDRLLASAADALGIPTLHDLDAPEITAVMAAAGAVFTTSMHAAIVSASFGTPVMVPGVGKTRDAFQVCPEPPPMVEVDDATLREHAERLIGTRVRHSITANRAAAVAAFADTLRATGAF